MHLHFHEISVQNEMMLKIPRENANEQTDSKFICSEKATKFSEIFTLLLTVCTVVKSKVKISLNSVAFSEYMNFTIQIAKNYWDLGTCRKS